MGSRGGSNVGEDNWLELTKRDSTFAGVNAMHEPKKRGGGGESEDSKSSG